MAIIHFENKITCFDYERLGMFEDHLWRVDSEDQEEDVASFKADAEEDKMVNAFQWIIEDLRDEDQDRIYGK